MKRIFTLLALVIAAVATQAQIMYDNSETTRLHSYGFDIPFPDQLGNGLDGTEWPGWHGVLVQYTANPWPDATNDSPTVLAYSRNPAEVYDVIVVNTGDMADVTDYVAGTKQFTMDVWSPIPGTVFQVTLENQALAAGGYPEGRHSEYQATSTLGAQWESLTFSLTGEPWSQSQNASWWPDAATAHNDVDRYVILINPGNQEGNQYYLDNITGPELAVEPCTEESDMMIINDGDCNQNHWYPEYADGRMSLVADPDASQTDNCLEYARNGGAENDVVVGNFGQALPLGDNPQIHMDLYALSAVTSVTLVIQDNLLSDLANITVPTSGTLNAWETLTFDLSSISNFPNATNFVFLVDPGLLEAKTVYLDNIRLENEVSVNETAARELHVYPNPFTDILNIDTTPGQGTWTVLDAAGRVVMEDTGAWGNRLELDLADLPVGTYQFQLIQDGQLATQTLIKR